MRDVSERRAAQEQLDVPGVPRRAHPLAEPLAVPRAARAGVVRCGDQRPPRRGAVPRRRPLQARERHARPRHRRPPARDGRGAAAVVPAADRHRRPLRRRRVQLAARQPRGSRRRDPGRRAGDREPARADAWSASTSCSCRRASASRSRVGGQERASDLLRQSDLAMYVAKDERAGPLGALRSAVGAAHDGAPRARGRPVAGDRPRRARGAVPTRAGARHRTGDRDRGADPLAAPDRGAHRAGPVRAVRGGVGADRRDRPVRVARGVRLGAPVVDACVSGRAIRSS